MDQLYLFFNLVNTDFGLVYVKNTMTETKILK